MGYLIGDEPPFGINDGTTTPANLMSRFGIGIQVLAQGNGGSYSPTPAKTTFLSELQSKYGSGNTAALNAAWDTNIASYATLLSDTFTIEEGAVSGSASAASVTNANVQADLHTFMVGYNSAYFYYTNKYLKLADPNHLYLCTKFTALQFTPETLTAAKTYCDVVTFDIYQVELTAAQASLLTSIQKPVMITEFNNEGVDTGFFQPEAAPQASQEARGQMYTNYIQNMLAIPTVVGFEWYKYIDDPITGRNGAAGGMIENNNTGFVSVSDTPYEQTVTGSSEPLIVDAARAVNASVYAAHEK